MFAETHNSIPWWGWAKLIGLGLALLAILKSGLWPKDDDPRAWYDRSIRIFGSVLLLIMFGAGIYLGLHHWRWR